MDLQSHQNIRAARDASEAPRTMSSVQDPIRLENAGLDERNGEIIAHGWLGLDALNRLMVDTYQREVLFEKRRRGSIHSAIKQGVRLPDIMLGMRGERFETKGASMLLQDRVYIVDGLQRVAALRDFAEKNPEEAAGMRIGAEVRFATTQESERELFITLNTSRVAVSPNVILRNMRGAQNPGITSLYGLSLSDKTFALFERVTWTQRMARNHLLTALILARTVRSLHGFAANTAATPKGAGDKKASGIVNALNRQANAVGLATFRRNTVDFFDIVDACWGIRNVEYNQTAVQLRGNFLSTLGKLFSEHQNFWDDGGRLFVDAATKKKLASFPLLDPEVSRLAAAGSMTMPILMSMLVEHLNKGKRLGTRLRKRNQD